MDERGREQGQGWGPHGQVFVRGVIQGPDLGPVGSSFSGPFAVADSPDSFQFYANPLNQGLATGTSRCTTCPFPSKNSRLGSPSGVTCITMRFFPFASINETDAAPSSDLPTQIRRLSSLTTRPANRSFASSTPAS